MAYYKYRALCSWQKKIGLYEQQQEVLISVNCSMKQSPFLLAEYGEDSPYVMHFSTHSTLSIRKIRLFKFIASTSSAQNARNVLLCDECVHRKPLSYAMASQTLINGLCVATL